jgi:hypothetical protein
MADVLVIDCNLFYSSVISVMNNRMTRLLAARSPPLGQSGRRPPIQLVPAPLPGSPPLPPPEGSAEAAWLPRMAAAGPSFGWRRFLRGGGAVRGGPAGRGDGGGVRRRILRPFGRIRPSPHRICGLRPSPYPPSLASPALLRLLPWRRRLAIFFI